MQLPTIPHTSQVQVIKDLPRSILHVKAMIPEGPAWQFAGERHDLLKALALATGPRTGFDTYEIQWTEENA